MTQVARFVGADLAAFCELFQNDTEHFHDILDWDTIRDCDYVLGMPDPPLYFGEENELMIGNIFGRNWFVPARCSAFYPAVERSFRQNRSR